MPAFGSRHEQNWIPDKHFIEGTGPNGRPSAKPDMCNPFSLFARLHYLEEAGKAFPKVIYWPGDVIRLLDPIPVRLIPGWDGVGKKSNRRLSFTEIKDTKKQVALLLQRTHWGSQVLTWSKCDFKRFLETDTSGLPQAKVKDLCRQRRLWAKRFIVRLEAFLEGCQDPFYPESRAKLVYANGWKNQSRTRRSGDLLEILKTSDGLFA